jgi:hypothetical protein
MATPKPKIKWNKNLTKEVGGVLKEALVDITLFGERKAKEQLYPGRGVDTGAMKRATHAAIATFDYASAHVNPKRQRKEWGGTRFRVIIIDGMFTGALGSNQNYSMYYHQGTSRFAGHRYIRETIPMMKAEMPKIVWSHARKHKV